HKQLEENPWETYETIFTKGSVHEGTISELTERGGQIRLDPYGVEGFATPKHLTKEDGTTAKQGETLQFKVIDFNKDSKHIILSHSRIFEDEQRSEARKARRQAAAAANKPAAEAAPAVPQMEKTTLGDVNDGLAALKAQLEQNEGKGEAPKTEE
ncbi:MAG: S1 RNA-binding domain-containing protein, partial [Muribaculaceae bacterium]|nr:S1 RNA-binding domain-containing protein [Muribaculaceae bacterium]